MKKNLKIISSKNNVISVLVIVFICIASFTYSQSFEWEAQINKATVSGFCKIQLTPAIVNKLNTGYTDIRLFSSKGEEVPYLFQNEIISSGNAVFKEYKILKTEHVANRYTQLIIHNEHKQPINHICLLIKNADVNKQITLIGSDNQKNWYVVKSDFILGSINSATTTTGVAQIDFPINNYEFFQVEINDSTSAPLNILKAGFYESYSNHTAYSALVKPTVVKTDSLRKSYFKISFKEAQRIDKIQFAIDAPAYFKRNAYLCQWKEVQVTKKTKRKILDVLTSFTLLSGDSNMVNVSLFNTTELFLVVENMDNPPLHIRAVNAFQQNHFITAYLTKKEDYSLQFGNNEIGAASYDIDYFTNKIPAVIPTITIQDITSIKKATQSSKASSFFKSKLFIWGALLVVAAFLIYMSVKMVNEMKEKHD